MSDAISLLQQATDAQQDKIFQLVKENSLLTKKLKQADEDESDMLLIAYLNGAGKQESKVRVLKEEVRKNRKLICNIYNAVKQEAEVKALIEREAGQWFVSGTDQTIYSKDVEL